MRRRHCRTTYGTSPECGSRSSTSTVRTATGVGGTRADDPAPAYFSGAMTDPLTRPATFERPPACAQVSR